MEGLVCKKGRESSASASIAVNPMMEGYVELL